RMGWCRCYVFFFSSRRRHTRFSRDWSSDVCSSDLFQVSFFEGRTSRRGLPSAIPHSSAVKIKTTIKEFQASFFEGRTSRRGLPRSEERRVGKEGGVRFRLLDVDRMRREIRETQFVD